MVSLPIDEVLPDVVRVLHTHDAVVVHAPTGAGKTTRLPSAVLDAFPGKAWVLEPRRIAARAAARHVSALRGCKVGEEVGHHVRFDHRATSATRLLYLTDGMALRRLQSDPFIEDVGVVIFDEFHERSLAADLALAMVRRVQQEVREDLKIVVMSATLDATRVSEWLGDAPVVRSEGRSYPVHQHWLARLQDASPEVHAARGVKQAIETCAGDLLVFLPGVREIHRTAGMLADLPVDVLPLYGDLSSQEQDRALRIGPRRRVVLATNVAETSLTLDGIEAVVDVGLARVLRHNPSSGLDRLVLEPISQASAEQRAGRAGRQGPGHCFRRWTKASHARRDVHDTPQLHRTDLCGPLLQLRAWGEPDPRSFPWYEAPEAHALEAANQTLRQLKLLDDGGLTTRGTEAAGLAVHPRLAVLMLHASANGLAKEGAGIAALLSERGVLHRDAPSPATSASDALHQLHALERNDVTLRPGARRAWKRTRDQLLRSVQRRGSAGSEEDLLRAILAAWPDRVALRRDADGSRGRMVGGRGVRLADQSCVRQAELFVCLDVLDNNAGARSEALVRRASAVKRNWLATFDHVELGFDEQLRKVTARKQLRYHDLVLRSTPTKLPRDERVADALIASIVHRLDMALPLDDEDVSSLRARIAGLHRWMPELQLPSADDAWLIELLPIICRGKRGWNELTPSAICEAMRDSLDYKQRRALNQHAPERIKVPSGSSVRLTYGEQGPPVLAVRIQELFGLAATPRIANGRVPVLLHLLAPNRRPAQITDDLAGFWKNTWFDVRKDLRRRYPKHAWPDDPLTARAEFRPRRNRR